MRLLGSIGVLVWLGGVTEVGRTVRFSARRSPIGRLAGEAEGLPLLQRGYGGISLPPPFCLLGRRPIWLETVR